MISRWESVKIVGPAWIGRSPSFCDLAGSQLTNLRLFVEAVMIWLFASVVAKKHSSGIVMGFFSSSSSRCSRSLLGVRY